MKAPTDPSASLSAVPPERLVVGQRVPVDVRAPDGRLLLRRGQLLASDEHRALLLAHQPCVSASDAHAWTLAIERRDRAVRLGGASAALAPQVEAADYADAPDLRGGWGDAHAVLQGILYQGAQAQQPLRRLEAIACQVRNWVEADADAALFELFQALPDLTNGYCASHALLTAALSALSLERLGQAQADPDLLRRSALVMNIGMARAQDALAQQRMPPNALQRAMIQAHALTSAQVLSDIDLPDPQLIDLVRWHTEPGSARLPAALQRHLQMLALTESLVAKLAPRASRAALSPLQAAQALLGLSDPATQALREALVATLGFYPPGTYVQLANGEIAVVVQRGVRAHTPHVASVFNAAGIPLSRYLHRDTASQADAAIRQSVAAHTIKLHIDPERILRLRRQAGLAA